MIFPLWDPAPYTLVNAASQPLIRMNQNKTEKIRIKQNKSE